jgi:4-amino-4-deoxy-L-arabinose transferase-like glycosyltransferase
VQPKVFLTSDTPLKTIWRSPAILYGILALGLVMRCFFVFVASKSFYPNLDGLFTVNGDSYSYFQSARNLLERGIYTFDPQNPEASFGREPGYPFFLLLHFVVFGFEKGLQAAVISQLLLDVVSIYLIYAISRRLFHPASALGLALVYALYPFTMVWIPVIGTELFATFLTLLFFWGFVSWKNRPWGYAVIGLLAAACLLTRMYLGALLLVPFISILWESHFRLRTVLLQGALCMAGFLMLYGSWPIRNYLQAKEVILLKPATAGYPEYSQDYNAFRNWVQLWDTDVDYYTDKVFQDSSISIFPERALASPEEQAVARQALQLALSCSKGFQYQARESFPHHTPSYSEGCTQQAAQLFDSLSTLYRQREPLQAALYVPGQNIKKLFLKSETKSEGSTLVRLLFGYRSLLLLLAFGVLLYGRTYTLLLLAAFPLFMYLFICIGLRQLEMRYVLQADVVMLLLLNALFLAFFTSFEKKIR